MPPPDATRTAGGAVADAVTSSDGSGRLRRLLGLTGTAVLSSNVDTFKVLTFDRTDAVLPARRLSGLPRSQALADFRRRQGADFAGGHASRACGRGDVSSCTGRSTSADRACRSTGPSA